jgi:hypothetical protein
MHPHLMEELAAARRRELLATAGRSARPRPGRRQPRRRSARQRAGWMLVEIGLKLANGPGGA